MVQYLSQVLIYFNFHSIFIKKTCFYKITYSTISQGQTLSGFEKSLSAVAQNKIGLLYFVEYLRIFCNSYIFRVSNVNSSKCQFNRKGNCKVLRYARSIPKTF